MGSIRSEVEELRVGWNVLKRKKKMKEKKDDHFILLVEVWKKGAKI